MLLSGQLGLDLVDVVGDLLAQLIESLPLFDPGCKPLLDTLQLLPQILFQINQHGSQIQLLLLLLPARRPKIGIQIVVACFSL